MKYKCPTCEEISNHVDWNRATENRFGGAILPVEDIYRGLANYICPKCNAVIDGDYITKEE